MFEVARETIVEHLVDVRVHFSCLSTVVEVVEPIREDCVHLHRIHHRHLHQDSTNISKDDYTTLDAKQSCEWTSSRVSSLLPFPVFCSVHLSVRLLAVDSRPVVLVLVRIPV